MAFLGYNLNEIEKNPTWCDSGRSSKQNHTSKTPIGLIDFCQTCQPGTTELRAATWVGLICGRIAYRGHPRSVDSRAAVIRPRSNCVPRSFGLGRIACRGQYFCSEFIRANQPTFTFAKVAYRRYLFIYFFFQFNDRIYHSIYMIILKC